MRRFAWSLVAVAAMVAAAPPAHASKEEDLARARALDQQGVRAYKEGRYNDAIQYFSEAFKLGGPPSELWNIAKCHIRLDQPQEASDAYERYMMQPGLSPQDKAEATEQMDELRRRRSILTVASEPSRATVYLDGRKNEAAGQTPFSVQVPPGTHKVEIGLRGYKPYEQEVEAKFGRAIIVDAQLEKDPNYKPEKPPPPPPPPGAAPSAESVRRFTVKGEMGFVFSKLGSYSQDAHFGLGLSGGYWIVASSQWLLGAGLMMRVTSDGWGNTINAPSIGVQTCAQAIPSELSATEVSGYGVGMLGYRITPQLRVGADTGLGFATYSVSVLGGDLFYPTCRPSTGTQVAARAGLEVSYAVLPMLRATATPISLEVHPSYTGARPGPIDATGAWVRFGVALGLAVDL